MEKKINNCIQNKIRKFDNRLRILLFLHPQNTIR